MRNLFATSIIAIVLFACTQKEEGEALTIDWKERTLTKSLSDSLEVGVSYLSVYSEIYSRSEHLTHDLTVTISIRNTNATDTIYLDRAEYFNTQGKSIRSYFSNTIFVAPLETVEIVIDESDKAGGTGGNFIFDWKMKSNCSEPLFESVMISTSGQQGLSFATQGKRIK